MKTLQKNYALITGASNGIGKFLALDCAKRNINLVLVALPGTGLDSIAYALQMRYNVDVKFYETDLTDAQSPKQLHDWCIENNLSINMLINNAGVGYEGLFENISIDFCSKMMQLNTQTVVMLTRLFFNDLKKHDKAFILNVSSLASFTPMPYKSMYAASKSFIYSFTRALRSELSNTNISVSVLCPGAVPTSDVMQQRIQSHGWFAKHSAINPDDLATIAIEKMLEGKAVIIPGILNNMSLWLMKTVPEVIQQLLLVREYSRKISSV